MALKMICSHWLVCGWMLSLLVGAGVAIFQRYAHPTWFTSMQHSFPDLRSVKWDGGWSCYADIRGRLDEDRVQMGRSHQQGITGILQGRDGSGWSYA